MEYKPSDLREAVVLACKPQRTDQIVVGRNAVLSMDKKYVLSNIEVVASECLDLDDYWEYRRYLELCNLLDKALLNRIVQLGCESLDPEIREASNDFSSST